MSGFGSRRSVRFLEVSKPGDRDATRGKDGEVYRRAGALSGGVIELRGGGRAARGQRATLPASSRPLRGGRGGRFDRSSPRSGFRAAGAGGPDRVCHRAVPDTLLGLYGEALPRGAASRARGEAVIAYFGYPAAHEDDAER